MKLSLIQVFLAVLVAGVSLAHTMTAQDVLSKKLSLKADNRDIRSILADIESVSEVRFAYRPRLLPASQKISFVATNEALSDVLNRLLTPLQVKYRLIGQQIVLTRESRNAAAIEPLSSLGYMVTERQARTITGTVTDETNGGTLPGVSVVVKGSTKGTATDANGKYSLTVGDADQTLVFSYIGYERREMIIGNASVVDVVLKASTNSLNEVVVVGYGTQQKRDLTGSISSVKSEDIKSLPVTGLDQAIQGRAAGVQITQNNAEPGGSVSIRIRGVGSINGSEPLVVVDGLPMAGSLNSINPNDIESMEILKDASSAAIYGSRAANGVILVTTKRGKAGQTRVELDTYYGVQSPGRQIPVLNGPEFATLANEAYRNSNTAADRRLNPAWANPASLPSYDWQKAIFQNSPIYSINLNVSGGTEKSRSAVSLNYFRQDGLIVNSNYDRYSLRINNDFQASKRVRFGSNLYIARDNGQYIQTNDFSAGVLQTAYQMQPMQPIFATGPDGLQSPNVFNYDGFAHLPLSTDGLYYPRQLQNPVWATKPEVRSDIRQLTRVFGTVFGEVDIIDGLKFRTSIGGDLSFNQDDYFLANNPVNVFGANNGQIQNRQSRSENASWNWINTLTYNRVFAQKHAFSALAGIDALAASRSGLTASANGFPSNDVRSLNFGSADSRQISSGRVPNSLFSYLGRLTYGYDNKYLLAFNIRRDGSSSFGPGNKFGVFPSASVGWRLSEEKFLKNVSLVSDLKLRASWGMLGNQNIGDYRFLNSLGNPQINYTVGTGAQSIAPGILVTNLANPNIQWESTTQTDIGLDASLLNGKINLTVDYYNRLTSNMLVNVPTPASLGAPENRIAQNAGSLTNSGLEFTAGYRHSSSAFKWSVDANFSTLKNRVTSLGTGTAIVRDFGIGGNNAATRTEVGQPIGYFWGLQTDGIFQTKEEVAASVQKRDAMPGDRRFRNLNVNGEKVDTSISANDRTNLGSGLPTFLFGATFKAEYKGFDFSMLLQGQGGNKIANNTRRQLYDIRNFNGAGVQNVSRDMLDRWTGPNTSNTMPRVAYSTSTTTNNLFSSYYIEDGMFLRCRNVQIGYTLPTVLSQKLKAARIRVYVSAQNLFTITKYSGYDPEIGSLYGDVLSTGIDQGRYPVAKMFMGGLNIGF